MNFFERQIICKVSGGCVVRIKVFFVVVNCRVIFEQHLVRRRVFPRRFVDVLFELVPDAPLDRLLIHKLVLQ